MNWDELDDESIDDAINDIVNDKNFDWTGTDSAMDDERFDEEVNHVVHNTNLSKQFRNAFNDSMYGDRVNLNMVRFRLGVDSIITSNCKRELRTNGDDEHLKATMAVNMPGWIINSIERI